MSNVPPDQQPPAPGYQPPPPTPSPGPAWQQQQPGGYGQPAPPSGTPTGRPLTITGFVLAGLALLFLPPLFALIGVILSVVAMSKGDPLAKWSLVASIAGGVIGMIIGVLVVTARS